MLTTLAMPDRGSAKAPVAEPTVSRSDPILPLKAAASVTRVALVVPSNSLSLAVMPVTAEIDAGVIVPVAVAVLLAST